MKITVIGRKCTPRDSFKSRAEKKLEKVEKLFGEEIEAKITATVEKNIQIVEITIFHKGMFFRSQVRADNMNEALDRCVDSIVRQIRKNKTKVEKKLHETLPSDESYDVVEDETEYKIIRSKEIDLKPQTLDEAILQMNLLEHKFYVFQNSADSRINVVYARSDGGYGVIIPNMD